MTGKEDVIVDEVMGRFYEEVEDLINTEHDHVIDRLIEKLEAEKTDAS